MSTTHKSFYFWMDEADMRELYAFLRTQKIDLFSYHAERLCPANEDLLLHEGFQLFLTEEGYKPNTYMAGKYTVFDTDNNRFVTLLTGYSPKGIPMESKLVLDARFAPKNSRDPILWELYNTVLRYIKQSFPKDGRGKQQIGPHLLNEWIHRRINLPIAPYRRVCRFTASEEGLTSPKKCGADILTGRSDFDDPRQTARPPEQFAFLFSDESCYTISPDLRRFNYNAKCIHMSRTVIRKIPHWYLYMDGRLILEEHLPLITLFDTLEAHLSQIGAEILESGTYIP